MIENTVMRYRSRSNQNIREQGTGILHQLVENRIFELQSALQWLVQLIAHSYGPCSAARGFGLWGKASPASFVRNRQISPTQFDPAGPKSSTAGCGTRHLDNLGRPAQKSSRQPTAGAMSLPKT